MTKKRTGRERENRLRAIGDLTGSKRAERALRELEEQWRSLVENIPDIVMTVDADGTILFINRTVPGFTVEGASGTSVYDYVPPEHHDTMRESLEGVFEAGEAHDFEIAGAGPFGRTSWYFNRIGPVVRDGRVVAASLIATDITERKRVEEALRESEERYRDLAENLNDAIFEFDTSGRMSYVSPGMEEVSGYSASELIGRPFTDLLHPDDLPAVTDKIQKRPFGNREPSEYRLLRKSGEARWVHSLGSPMFEGDRVIGFRVVLTDITERKLAEEALRQSEERYRRLVENINEAIYEVDAGGRITYISPVIEEASGYSPSEIVGRPFADFLHPDDLSGAVENLQRAVSGHPRPNEYRLLSKAGEVLWVRSFGRPILQEDRVVGVRGVLTNITERKLAEEALRESEERWRSLAENVPDIIMTVDADGTILFANRVVPGLTVESVIGTNLNDYLPPEHRDRQRRALERVFETGEPQSYEIAGTGPHGSTSWYFSRIGPVARGDKVVAAILITTDVTMERRAEEALRQSEDRYRTLVEAAPDVIYSLSKDGTITSLNSAFELISGWSRDEWLGKHFAPIIHPDDLPAVIEDFRLVLRGEVPPVGEYRMLAKPGQYLTAETLPRPLIVDGKVVGAFGIARDITERRRAEEALRESEERYRDLVELSPYAMAVHGEEKMVFVNSAGVQLFGAAAPHEIIGRPIWDFVHPDHLKAARKRIQGAWTKGKKADLVEEKLVRLDGQVIVVEMVAIPITYGGKAARQVVLRDITERKRMEEALQETREELESTVERQMQRGTSYGLTFRELTVLHLMADGRSDREIGTVLGISTLTAHKHAENIRTKMAASSRTEASVRAVREGLLD